MPLHRKHSHVHHQHHKRQFDFPSFDDIQQEMDKWIPDNNDFGQGTQSRQGGNSDDNDDQPIVRPAPEPEREREPAPAPIPAQRRDDDDDIATAISIVYVTAEPTFSGPVRGYSTVDDEPTPTPKPPKPSKTNDENDTNDKPPPAPTSTKTTVATRTKTPVTDSVVSSTPTLEAVTATTSANPVAVSASPSSTSAPEVESEGMSGGAKAGIAIGVILSIALLVGGAFAYYRWKKSQEINATAGASNEKNPFGDNALTSGSGPPPPPMASTFGAVPAAVATGAAFGGAGAAKAATHEAPRSGSAHASNPANPFGNHAETVQTPTSATHPAPVMTATSGPLTAPVEEKIAVMDSDYSSNGATVGAGAAAGIAGAAAVGAARHNEKRKNVPQPINMQAVQNPPAPFAAAMAAQPSPALSYTSTGSAASGSMGAPSENVHRVQLDFKPSMDDELELTAGQLVRLIHEYDDGWALCARLDRSQQGVVPRTCLSSRPMKPRRGPNGPPPRGPPAMRGPPGPPGPPGPGRNGPPRSRSPGPANLPRPQMNQGQRSMSPGPYGGGPQSQPGQSDMRPRSNSANNTERRPVVVPGPSPLNSEQKPANSEQKLAPYAMAPTNTNSVAESFELPIQHPRNMSPLSQASRPVSSGPISPAPLSPVNATPAPLSPVQRKPVPATGTSP